MNFDWNEFFKNPIWGFLGALAGLFALVVAIASVFIRRKIKKLSYEVVADTPVIAIHEEMEKSNLKITYNGASVNNVQLLILKIINTGNQPIPPTDFIKPLTICLPGNSQVLSLETVEKYPKNLSGRRDLNGSNIEISNTLLNPSDYFVFKMIVGNYSGSFRIESRILGIEKVEMVKPEQGVILGTVVGLLLSLAGVIWSSRIMLPEHFEYSKELYPNLLMVSGYLISFISMRSKFRKLFLRLKKSFK